MPRRDIERAGRISYSQEGEDAVLASLLGERPTGFYVDVGALDPTRFSNTRYFHEKGWHGINIEPSPEGFRAFTLHRQKDINLNIGISDRPGELMFYSFNEPALSTFDRDRAEHLEKTTHYQIANVRPVPVERLETVLAEHAPNMYIDVMNIDVEHHEIAVLSSNDWNRFRPEVLLVEILDFDLYTILENPVHKFLSTNGYRFVCKTPRTCFYVDTRKIALPAPVILFVYNRPKHTRATLANLLNNPECPQTDLYVFSDGPKSPLDTDAVQQVREIVAKVSGFRSLQLRFRDTNAGLANSIISGVTEVIGARGAAIVLEDDLLVSPHFLHYMNSALERYANNHQVASIHGWNFPLKAKNLPDSFFLRGADCWGWATWKRAWSKFEPNGQKLLSELESRRLTRHFDLEGAYPYTQMLRDQIAGKNNSWAIRWHASAFLHNMVTLHPGESLVKNIGLDGSGVHSQPDTKMETNITDKSEFTFPSTVEENSKMRAEIIRHLRSGRPGLLKSWFSRWLHFTRQMRVKLLSPHD